MASSPPLSAGVAALRLSSDSMRESLIISQPNGANGHIHDDAEPAEMPQDVDGLKQELERVRVEKEDMAEQYRSLLAKLTTMRTTLGNKLKEDAEELDRRETLVQQLTSQNEELSETVVTLRDELVSSNAESQNLTEELSLIRSRVQEESAFELQQLHEIQRDLEICRNERDDWERAAQQESVAADEARTQLANFRRDFELEQGNMEQTKRALEVEREKLDRLQGVLEDFESAKEAHIRHALADFDTQIRQTTQSLAEYKSRALSAEAELSELNSSSRRVAELEREVSEKTALVAKLRHDSVIANEHLTEALRRLRKTSSAENVDRRLVTNILLQYLSTSRGDGKRFEMLSLLASILSWSDAERESAGLQRTTTSSLVPPGRSVSGTVQPTTPVKTEESESFSKMWVEFLLKEAAQGAADVSPMRTSPPAPLSAAGSNSPSGMWSPGGRTPTYPRSVPASSRRQSVASSHPDMSSPPPPRKPPLP